MSTDIQPQPRRAPSDVFRPRLPLDPFAPPVDSQNRLVEPEFLDPDAPWPVYDLPARTAAYAQVPHVLLVLGAPSPRALTPILRSPTFTRSLVLLVTHLPPTLSAFSAVSAHTGPAVRILHLDTPLVPTAPAFALTLVHVLDAAADVARAWRASSPAYTTAPDIHQLAQDPTGAFSVPEALALDTPAPLPVSEHLHPPGRRPRLAPRPQSTLSVPAGRRNSTLLVKPPPLSAPPAISKRDSSASLGRSAGKRAKSASTDPARPFDALLAFLPPAQPERAVLKQVVLTSTLAGGFLTGPPYAAGPYTPSSGYDSDDARFDWSSAPATPTAPGPYTAQYGYPDARPGSAGSSASRAGSFGDGGGESPTRRSRLSSLFRGASRSVPASPRASASFLASASSLHHPAPGRGTARAHIVHVLPASYRGAKLTGALGAFLASYAAGGVRAYVLAERALRDLEGVLVGGLEPLEVGGGGGRRGAWVAGVLSVSTPPATSREDADAGADELGPEAEAEAEVVEGEGGEEQGGIAPYGLPTPPASRNGSGEGAEEGYVAGMRRRRTSSSGGYVAREGSNSTVHATGRTPSSAGHSRAPSSVGHGNGRTPSSAGHGRTPSSAGHGRAPSSAGHGRAPSSAGHGRTPSSAGHGPSPPSAGLPPGAAPPQRTAPAGTTRVRRAGSPAEGDAGARQRTESEPASAPPPASAPAGPARGKDGRARLRQKEKPAREGRFFGGKGPGDFRLTPAAPPPPPSARSAPDLHDAHARGKGGGGDGRRKRWWAFWG
ncbi:hypothetical protein DFH07DRAFT_1063681 [Mycena maculata]|uniref:Uncharacterized protein n=1 Tax=Mycena maculata TaxID=230809 RepID=A0AAD7IIM6_9AGAR|nr:hypothetical protein DFH07DRAFT_1063681 [Mycena maculata]